VTATAVARASAPRPCLITHLRVEPSYSQSAYTRVWPIAAGRGAWHASAGGGPRAIAQESGTRLATGSRNRKYSLARVGLSIEFRLYDHPASGEAMGLDVFISYSHHDKAAADAACAM